MRSRVPSDPDALRAHVQAVRQILDDHLGEPSNDRWFPRTFDAQLGVIDHLNRLLDSGETREAVLVDPFFGEEALQRLVLRLTRTGLNLTIVACWGRTDPDTGAPVKGGAAAAVAEGERRLKPLLARIGPQIAPDLKLVNVVTGSGSQAFHDRYLLLHPHSGPFQVFLLSNSINNAAANWPFCMSLLSGQARVEAKHYIDGLAQGRDVTGSTDPKISFKWPPPIAGNSPPT